MTDSPLLSCVHTPRWKWQDVKVFDMWLPLIEAKVDCHYSCMYVACSVRLTVLYGNCSTFFLWHDSLIAAHSVVGGYFVRVCVWVCGSSSSLSKVLRTCWDLIPVWDKCIFYTTDVPSILSMCTGEEVEGLCCVVKQGTTSDINCTDLTWYW